MAGGPQHDSVFGQGGNDIMQGDASVALTVSATQPSVADLGGPGSDGDDYMEGNGGNDVLYGNLGQDDLLGGSSDLFGQVTRRSAWRRRGYHLRRRGHGRRPQHAGRHLCQRPRPRRRCDRRRQRRRSTASSAPTALAAAPSSNSSTTTTARCKVIRAPSSFWTTRSAAHPATSAPATSSTARPATTAHAAGPATT